MNACPSCGANLALVGRMHRCVTVTIDKPAKDSVTPTKRNTRKRGRKRQYVTNAERQRAYRERKKQPPKAAGVSST